MPRSGWSGAVHDWRAHLDARARVAAYAGGGMCQPWNMPPSRGSHGSMRGRIRLALYRWHRCPHESPSCRVRAPIASAAWKMADMRDGSSRNKSYRGDLGTGRVEWSRCRQKQNPHPVKDTQNPGTPRNRGASRKSPAHAGDGAGLVVRFLVAAAPAASGLRK